MFVSFIASYKQGYSKCHLFKIDYDKQRHLSAHLVDSLTLSNKIRYLSKEFTTLAVLVEGTTLEYPLVFNSNGLVSNDTIDHILTDLQEVLNGY